MKDIFFIENNENHFTDFSDLLSKNGYVVYPKINPNGTIVTGSMLAQALGIYSDADEPIAHENSILSNMKNTIFSYINEQRLFAKVNAVILDIDLTGRIDTIGLKFLEAFRTEFIPCESKYSYWSSIIPVIALTNYKKAHYEQEFRQHSGYLLDYFSKNEVERNPSLFLTSVENFCRQMHAIQRFFTDKEFGDIVKLINTQNYKIEEIVTLSKLTLLSNISMMDADKRNALIDNYSLEIIKYVNDINGFMVDVENIEEKFSRRLQKFFDSGDFKTVHSIIWLTSNFKDFIVPEKVESVFGYAASLIGNLFQP